MKNLTFLLFTVLLCLGIQGFVSAQDSAGNITLEGGLGYGGEIKSPGLQIGGAYRIDEKFRGVTDIIYYFPGKDSRGFDYSWLEFNVNGHYFFVDDEDVIAYALAGLNFAKLYSDQPNIRLPGGDRTDTLYAGLNIGAGAEFPLGSVNAYIEGKYALSSAHQLALTAGVRVPIGKN